MWYLIILIHIIYIILVECEFENNDTCGWTQDASDQFDWQIGYGNTTSWATGPKADHTYETGFGNTIFANLQTYVLPYNTCFCFKFVPLHKIFLKFSIKDFFSKCDQIRKKLRICLHLLKKSLMKKFNFFVQNLLEIWKKQIWFISLPISFTSIGNCVREKRKITVFKGFVFRFQLPQRGASQSYKV